MSLISEGWINTASIAWAKNGHNACYINWSGLSSLPFNYFHAAKLNLPEVAKFVARFLRRLKEIGYHLNEVELAGHSLGCQLFAQVAQQFQNTNDILKTVYGIRMKFFNYARTVVTNFYVLCRCFNLIVGLDCAKPCFVLPQLTPDRLNMNAARIVQAIHTNAFYGQLLPVGCIDFYVDSILEPKCTFSCTILQLTLNPGACIVAAATCSHDLAFKLFILTLNEMVICKGTEFSIITIPFLTKQYRLGVFGERVCNKLPFYLPTNKNYPYCPKI